MPRWSPDSEVTPISRTVGQGRVVDELIVGFTHDREMDAILPGIKSTGRRVELPPAVDRVGLKHEKGDYEHVCWDQASALYQLGLLPEGLPVVGAEAAQRLRDPYSVPANRLIARWAESDGEEAAIFPTATSVAVAWTGSLLPPDLDRRSMEPLPRNYDGTSLVTGLLNK
jgi:hypothetical protein